MKHSIVENNTRFTPITITLTVETGDELEALRSMLGKRHTDDIQWDSFPLFNEVDDLCRDRGLESTFGPRNV